MRGGRSTKTATGHDAERLDSIAHCIPCLLNAMYASGWDNPCWEDARIVRVARRFTATRMPVERHHTLSGGIRRGHRYTFGNCLWHHKALLRTGYTTSRMSAAHGPSLLKGSKTFHAVYGSDDELIAMQDWVLFGDELPDWLEPIPRYHFTTT